MSNKKIRRALISVYDKTGIEAIARKLSELGVEILSTGGTREFIEDLGIEVTSVESLTEYPSILGGRVKTLHPKIFGGILAKRDAEHRQELSRYNIPEIDLVIVDLYPFEETLKSGKPEAELIEQIDIGGISLIRAAAKNFNDILVIPSREHYDTLSRLLEEGGPMTTRDSRLFMAAEAFMISTDYDELIAGYLIEKAEEELGIKSESELHLRYGENPHQGARFFGDLEEILQKIQGKDLSYNNLNDIDAAISLMQDMPDEKVCCAIFKHTNACGLAIRDSVEEAWKDALAGDPVSAFGGILIFNSEVNDKVATEVNKLFYEVLIAPSYSTEALKILSSKKKRIILKLLCFPDETSGFKSLLNGMLSQELDRRVVTEDDFQYVTKLKPEEEEIQNMLFANLCVKHLKSNAIALIKDMMVIGIGTGQTSRVDALEQAIEKARRMGFDTRGAVMASDAFFPFPDCVEIAHKSGIDLVIQPGGSIKDQESIDYCDEHSMKMVLTGVRHFKHG